MALCNTPHCAPAKALLRSTRSSYARLARRVSRPTGSIVPISPSATTSTGGLARGLNAKQPHLGARVSPRPRPGALGGALVMPRKIWSGPVLPPPKFPGVAMESCLFIGHYAALPPVRSDPHWSHSHASPPPFASPSPIHCNCNTRCSRLKPRQR
jgi:hypothetical protein